MFVFTHYTYICKDKYVFQITNNYVIMRKEFLMNSINSAIIEARLHGKILDPVVSNSKNYVYWKSIEDFKRCKECADLHGKIYSVLETPSEEPPLHGNDRCILDVLMAIEAGTATIDGINGADLTLFNEGILPDYYVNLFEAEANGWKRGKWPINFVPGKMITKGIYTNSNKHLPDAPGRIWYEADINYITGKRNNQRVLWSSDGLVFVTYNHYETFIEII